MRFQFSSCCSVLLILASSSYADTTQPSTKKTTAPQQSTPKAQPANTSYPIDLSQFNKKNFYFSLEGLYGTISDGGITGTAYAQTIQANGQVNNVQTPSGSNFGYAITLAYKLTPDALKALTARYMSLNTTGKSNTGVGTTGFMYNELTQVSDPLNGGAFLLSGPASASSQNTFDYQNIDLMVVRPWDDAGFANMTFTKSVGLRLTYLTKGLTGQYTGFIQNNNPGTVYTTDNVDYSADYYGIGPQIGVTGMLQLMPSVKAKGGGLAAFLAGYYHSNLNETMNAAQPINIQLPGGGGGQSITSSTFASNENHPAQAWTPLIFEADFSVQVDLIKHPNHQNDLSLESGVSTEYLLPTFSNDSYFSTLGQDLPKLNNNLTLVNVFLKLNYNLD